MREQWLQHQVYAADTVVQLHNAQEQTRINACKTEIPSFMFLHSFLGVFHSMIWKGQKQSRQTNRTRNSYLLASTCQYRLHCKSACFWNSRTTLFGLAQSPALRRQNKNLHLSMLELPTNIVRTITIVYVLVNGEGPQGETANLACEPSPFTLACSQTLVRKSRFFVGWGPRAWICSIHGHHAWSKFCITPWKGLVRSINC